MEVRMSPGYLFWVAGLGKKKLSRWHQPTSPLIVGAVVEDHPGWKPESRRIYQSGTPFQPLPTLRGKYTPPENAWTLAKLLASFLERSPSGARLTGLKRHWRCCLKDKNPDTRKQADHCIEPGPRLIRLPVDPAHRLRMPMPAAGRPHTEKHWCAVVVLIDGLL